FGLMVGLWPRLCAALFGGLFAYVQVLDRTHYLNHYYLVVLLCGLLALMPLSSRATVPAWTLYTLRAQLLGVYFFSGFAKLQPDWLVRHQPMRLWLSTSAGARSLSPLVSVETLAAVSSWGGALIVLCAPPLLLVPRVRPYAYAALVSFHVFSGALLPLGIFPWLMVLALLIFFEPGALRPAWIPRASGARPPPFSPPPRWVLGVLGVHAVVQVLLPLRHWLYPGNLLWTEEGFRFSWHLKIREKHGQVRFHATDPATGRRWKLNPEGLLTDKQAGRMTTQPDLILAFAHVLAERTGIPGVEVRADARISLNGRPARPLIDPEVNLVAQEDGFEPKPWILPLDE
ncbi:MAG: HTTM domain-containing protein, partial [Cystobacter sp.]